MRVAGAEAGKKHAALIGAAIAVVVAQVDEFIVVADISAAVARLDALHHVQPLGEFPRLVRTPIAVGVFAHEDEVSRLRARREMRIRRRAGDKHPSALVP